MNTFIRAAAVLVLVLILSALTQACTTYNGTRDPQPENVAVQRQEIREACGIHDNKDMGQCIDGLECFGYCTFECGEKYTQQADGEFVYMLDTASVARCTDLGGTCGDSLGVGINICNLVSL